MADLAARLAALSPEQRATLEKLVGEPAGSRAGDVGPAPAPATPGERVPLSHAQRQMWFLDKLDPDSAAYHVTSAWRLLGRCDEQALRAAFAAVLRRHAGLRTVFPDADGEAWQQVLPEVPAVVRVDDLTGLPAAQRVEAAQAIARLAARRRFDLATGPLVRLRLVRLGPDEHYLLLNFHHIVVDGWSVSIVLTDLLTAYTALVEGTTPPWRQLTATPAEFAIEQRRRDNDRANDLAYWRSALRDLPDALDLPTDHARPGRPDYRGHRTTFWLDETLTNGLRELASREQATLFSALLAGWQVLLSRYTGQTDIAVGTPVSIRSDTRFEQVVGLLLNTLVLRGDLGDDPGFGELVHRTSETAFEAFEHRELPFEMLVDELAGQRDRSRNPLFQTMLVLQNTPARPSGAAGLLLTPLDFDRAIAKFDLHLMVTEVDDRLRCDLDCAAEVFEPARGDRIAGHFAELLRGAVAAPRAPVSGLPLLNSAELAELARWNRTTTRYPERGWVGRFADQVAATPGAPAIRFRDTCLSYAELGARVDRLARRLHRAGAGPEQIVGVCLDRGIDLVVAAHAIQATGAAYLPLDPEYPPARLAFMIEDTATRIVITDRPDLVAAPTTMAPDHGEDLADDIPLPDEPEPDTLAYVIYTSGSTGSPKGVGVSHRAIANRLAWMQQYFPLSAADRVLHKTPFGFDVSVWELFWPLSVGAQLVVAEPGGHRDSTYLAELLARERITAAHFVPSMLDAFLDEPGLALASLRLVFCSGEALGADLAGRCRAVLPAAALHNLYGPTEAAVDVSWQPVGDVDVRHGVPIGRPVPNTRLEVLDERMMRCPVGVPGELYLGGVQLARGYLGRPDLTAQRFRPDPYGAPGGRLYRTGDLARWREDGALDYLGRLDNQVKLHGLRIELGEIEAALADLPGVRSAVVVVAADGRGQRLVGYLVVTDPAGFGGRDWAAELRARLPAYMVPVRYVRIDAIPLSRNGKLDRAALPAPDATLLRAPVTAPAAGTETAVVEVWREVLGAEVRSAEDNFFAVGGDSILSLKVISRLRARGFEVALQDLFAHPTVRELSARLTVAAGNAPAASAPRGRFGLLSAADRRLIGQEPR